MACEYCMYPDPALMLNNIKASAVIDNDGRLYIGTASGDYCINISFCPMCGRELGMAIGDVLEPFRHVLCDMCESFSFPAIEGCQKGLCPMVMDEVDRKSTHARTCSGFAPARRCGCCAHCITREFGTQGKCEVLGKKVSTGSERARDCQHWEEGI